MLMFQMQRIKMDRGAPVMFVLLFSRLLCGLTNQIFFTKVLSTSSIVPRRSVTIVLRQSLVCCSETACHCSVEVNAHMTD